MIVTPERLYGEQDNKAMVSLMDPDGKGEWSVRYLWIQHTEDNDTFYNNYFDPSLSQAGMNVRKRTADLKSDWAAHNQIFFDSADNGNLVWRVKVGNPNSKSIDYIEVWRNVEILEQHFGASPTTPNWNNDARKSFHRNLFEAGFDIRSWIPYNTISKELAIEYYKKFVEQYKQKEHCIINTQWKKELNPL